MQVVALSTPTCPDWRWRIVNNAGEVVEESKATFPTIAAAVAEGRRRLARIDAPDHSVPRTGYRSSSPQRRQ